MALGTTIIHCVIDPEPTAFHASDCVGATASFAVNLSIECPSDAMASDDVAGDEVRAKPKFAKFLESVQHVEFHRWRVTDAANPAAASYEHLGKVAAVSETAPLGSPGDMLTWLQEHKPDSAGARYWSTKAAELTGKDGPAIDSEAVGASHRLRAAQSWNAPIAHKFSLTHVLRLDAVILTEDTLVLPYFGDPGAMPTEPKLVNAGDQNTWEVAYDALGEVGEIACRSPLLGPTAGTERLNPETIDPTLTSKGYLVVDKHADKLRRATRWFEDRAASLMSPGPALAMQHHMDPEVEAYAAVFKIVFSENPQKQPTLVAPNAAWHAVAALCVALDDFLIGMLKPLSGDASEGEVLAPLTTVVLEQLEEKIRPAFALKDEAYEARTVTRALREAIGQSSLAQRSPDADKLVAELRHVHGIAPPAPDSTVDAKFLDALLRFHSKPSDPPVVDSAVVTTIEPLDAQEQLTVITRIVAEAEQRLQDEAGAEAAIVRLIETAARASNKRLWTLIAEKYLAEIGAASNTTLLGAVETATEVAWTKYRTLLEGSFNGAEAVRRASSSEFTRAALARPFPAGDTNPSFERLRIAIQEADFHSERLLAVTPDPDRCFEPLIKILVMPVSPLTSSETDIVGRHLSTAYEAAVAPLDSLFDTRARFIPDHAPQPLSIQIAGNIDGKTIDDFGKHFNGIAVAVRRIDTGDDTQDLWAHASLAHLTWDKDNNPATNPQKSIAAAIHPMLPAISDGRGPMFIEYQGFPFATAAFAETMLESGAGSYKPFYRQDSADYVDGFAPVPRLAYGRKFQSFAFITSNAGTLPLDLQLSAARPWMPRPDVNVPPAAAPELIATSDSRRRTAIGQMAMRERGGDRLRIGAPIDGVAPLAGDYPRVGLAADNATMGARDVFRESDGRGMLVVGRGETAPTRAEWRLTGTRWTGQPKQLVVRLFDGPAACPDGAGLTDDFEFNLPVSAADLAKLEEIVLRIEAPPKNAGPAAKWKATVICGAESEPKEFSSIVESFWLRLILRTEAGPAGVSFADAGIYKPDGVDAPLLILRPDDRAWKNGLARSVTVDVETPRVGYLDFDGWFANGTLPSTASGNAAAERLERALLAAYMARHRDEELANHLDRLPDPAVERIRIELMVLDLLVDGPAPVLTRNFDLAERLKTIAAGLVEPPKWTPRLLKDRLFKKIEESFKFTIEITSDTTALKLEEPTAAKFTAGVPAGHVAKLSLDALVPAARFEQAQAGITPEQQAQGSHPEVFDPGLMQYALRAVEGGYLAFPSAAVRVETMLDTMRNLAANDNEKAIRLAADMILARPIERSRRYEIVTRPDLPLSADQAEQNNQWRLLGEIDVTTQRWRPTGRPIYHHVAPKEHRSGGKVDLVLDPALPVQLDWTPPDLAKTRILATFEAEAFFDRPNIDAQTVTQKLLPLPARTTLQQHFWDAPSATYFRHRFTLRSRYAGALARPADREVNAWMDEKKLPTPAHAWTLRVAMLADLSRLLLTRPQLRTLIPLTTAPGAEAVQRSAPPILGVLQEPPFSRGGLADRVATEIKTGYGYGFKTKDLPVEILDARKEVGPIPYLDYRAMDGADSLGTALMAEGPIGLTFDPVNAPAPAFPNSMLALSPVAVAGCDQLLEEHFLGVSMRRLIDPEWTTDEAPPDSSFDAERCWSIKFELPLLFAPAKPRRPLLSYLADGIAAELLCIDEQGDILVVAAMKAAVDGVGGTAPHDVEVARVRKDFASALAVLHQPVAPGRYSSGIFALPTFASVDIARGRSNAPLMLASFEWSPPKPAGPTGAAVKTDKPPIVKLIAGDADEPSLRASVKATMASAPTFLAWTRTSRDFDFVQIISFDPNADWHGEPARVTELVAVLSSNHQTITLERSGTVGTVWPCSSTFRGPYPLHVHRQLAVLTTRYLKEPGRPVETFCRSAIVTGKSPTLIDLSASSQENIQTGIYQPPENCVRIVEIEMPAAILCGTGGQIPKTYEQAYFDLRSSGFNLADGPRTLRLLFRFVGSAQHLRSFKKVTISVWHAKPDASTPAPLIEVDLKNGPTGHFTIGLELVLSTGTPPVSVFLLRSDGTPQKSTAVASGSFAFVQPDNATPGFFVKVIATGGAGEFWADVSLLHSPGKEFSGAFDFNWLFSAPGGSEPALDVASAGLHRMVEAQARIVAVSPPIPIVSHR